jgi:hypothetical protein
MFFHSFDPKTRKIGINLLTTWSFANSLHDNGERIAEALRRDLGKPTFESYIAEIEWLKNDIVFLTRNLEKWVKDEKAPDISFPWSLTGPKIRKDPLGCVLVIGYVLVKIQSLQEGFKAITNSSRRSQGLQLPIAADSRSGHWRHRCRQHGNHQAQ